ncbi:MAG: hypothetical protein ABRQ27_01290 [Clostridiaceae bacterium]
MMSIDYEINTVNFYNNRSTVTDKDVLIIKNENFILRKEQIFDYPISIRIDRTF